MNAHRFVVGDEGWRRLEPHLPGKSRESGVTAQDNRLVMEAVFWRVRTASPWRDPLHGNACLHAGVGAACVWQPGTVSSGGFAAGLKRLAFNLSQIER